MFSPARAALAAAAVLTLVLLPETAALHAAAPAPSAPGPTPALARVAPLAHESFIRNMTGIRLKELGVPAEDAWRLVDRATAVLAREDASAILDGLADDAAALSGGQAGPVQARDVFARLEAVAGPRPLSTAVTLDLVARVFGYELPEPAGDGGALSLMAAGGPESFEPAPASSEPVPHVSGTCLACPSYDFGVYTPTPAWNTHSSSLSAPAPGSSEDCAWYAFQVQAGATYEFTTCPPGTASFDTVLDLFTDSCAIRDNDDDSCGVQSNITWVSDVTGEVRLKVRGYSGATGNYTLAYRRICAGDPDCANPNGTLAPPTTSCQYQAGNVSSCTEASFYEVDLQNNRTYTFTLCPSACPSASAGFDSRIELWFGAAIVGSSSDACGDDGEIVYTVPLAGDGTYCVKVVREAGATDAFTLGYSVACVPASGMDILPTSASTTSPDCSRNMTFTAGTTGTGPFNWTWTITPLSGQTAAPPSGASTTGTEDLAFSSVLTGAGDYQVTVTATNGCGTATNSIVFTMEDRGGPLLTPTADAVSCRTFAPLARRSAAGEPTTEEALASLTQDDVAMILTEPDPQVVQAALAEKLGLQSKSIVVLDRTVPGVVSPPGTMALGCGSPCTGFGTLQALHPYYDVALNCDNGDYTARTGSAHSVTTSSGSPQNVIFGGTGLSPGTSNLAWYVHDNGTFYQDPTGGSACLFDPPDTATEPDSTGIEAEWTVSPMPGVSLRLREEIVAFGDTEPNSGVRLTLGATNLPSSTQAVTLGVRWQIDYQNSWDDGPWFGQVRCEPFEVLDERSTEHEFTTAEIADIDFYRIQNNDSPPIFGNFSSATEIAGFPGTGKPDRLTYGRWWAMSGSPWNYVVAEGDPGPDSDSAVLFYYGFSAANGMTIAPGEGFSRSVIIFTAGENADCGGFRPGECATEAVLQVCPGECASVGATAVDGCGPVVVDLIDTTPGAPPCVGNPCLLSFPDEGTFVYTWRATDPAGNEVTCTSTVIVEDGPGCNQPPSCAAGGPARSDCRQAPVEGASVDDADGDAVSYTWTSDNPSVRVEPAAGLIAAGLGPRPLPPTTAILDDAVDPCGVTATLTLTVDDGRGGVSSCTTTVLFLDDVAPVVSSGPAGGGGGVICLWPPNHWYVPVAVADLGVAVSDSCTATTWTVVGCVSDQPDDAPDRAAADEWNGDGKTENDCVLSPDGQTIWVRSERCGSGPTAQDGRHYGIQVVATDACGNVSAPTVVGAVHVPHDQSPAEDGCLNPTEIGFKDLP